MKVRFGMNKRSGYFLTSLIFIVFICASTHLAYSQSTAGKIEGQITDSNGRPVALLLVTLTIAEQNQEKSHSSPRGITTKRSDNQGNYTIENVPPGRYLVSIEPSNKFTSMMGADSVRYPPYPQTFHPGTADITKARVVEVAPGATVTPVDITVEPPIKTYRIRGRVIDEQTGAPIPKVGFTITYRDENDGRGVDIESSYWQSDDNGQFKMMVVLPGHITIKPSPNAPAKVSADPIELEVTDKDITGLEVKVHLNQPKK